MSKLISAEISMDEQFRNMARYGYDFMAIALHQETAKYQSKGLRYHNGTVIMYPKDGADEWVTLPRNDEHEEALKVCPFPLEEIINDLAKELKRSVESNCFVKFV